MGINVRAKQQTLGVGPNKGKLAYIMSAEIYNSLEESKVISEAHDKSGIATGALQSAWKAIGQVIKVWATEGHSVPIPGLGTIRFSVKAQAVEDVKDVKTSLIKTRKIIFTPSTELKEEFANTSISITCIDKDGKVVKRVDSEDGSEITSGGEDDDTDTTGGSSDGSGSSSSDGVEVI